MTDMFDSMRDQIMATPLPARGRAGTRPVAAGVGALAAAGVAAAVIVVGGGPAAAPAPVQSRETAYVTVRVRTALTVRSAVMEWVNSGRVRGPHTPDEIYTDWSYQDPQTHAVTQHDTETLHGVTFYVQDTTGTAVGTTMHWRYVISDPVSKLYTVRSNTSRGVGLSRGSNVTLLGADQIRQDLRGARVKLAGRTTVDGTPALKLSVPTALGDDQRGGYTLYVNAHTYAPLKAVQASAAGTGTFTSHYYQAWLPASVANTARTHSAGIPAGFTRVSLKALNVATNRDVDRLAAGG